MSLMPYFFRDMMRPLRMIENQMRMADELLSSRYPWGRLNSPRLTFDLEEDSNRDAVIQDKDKIQVKLDVQHFKPEEISVKTIDGDAIHIEAKHEEKHPEGKGFISRQFVRRFMLPKGHDVKNATSSLSADGVLTITAPRVADAISEEKAIPITHETEKLEEK